jgi:hypothetical protein
MHVPAAGRVVRADPSDRRAKHRAKRRLASLAAPHVSGPRTCVPYLLWRSLAGMPADESKACNVARLDLAETVNK